MSDEPLVIDYYSDVLCVWAWIAQRRIDELQSQFNDRVVLRYHYMDVFGDTEGKMQSQWADRKGFEGFAEHVQRAAADYDNAPVHEQLWQQARPASSAGPHWVIKAVALAEGEARAAALALALRKAFFVDAKDIAHKSVLFAVLEASGIERLAVERHLDSGRAMASLMADYQKAKQWNIKGSPSYVMDNGRQTLYGNVGYRVLSANIEELLKKPQVEACWC